MLFWFCFIVLLSGVAFGGGTHAGYLGDAAVQFLSIPLLVTALWPALSEHNPDRHKARTALGVLCAVAFVTLLQVLPLPFGGHGAAVLLSSAHGQEAAPQAAAWAALSQTPQATWAAAISCIVPLAVFAAVLQLGLEDRLKLCWLLVGLGGLSLLLGFMQVAQGPESGLRFYAVTNPGEAVGLFANRNHFASQLYVTLALAAMWFQLSVENTLDRSKTGRRSLLLFAMAAAFLVATAGGLAFSRSIAGLILAAAALGGIVLIVFRQAQVFRHRRQRAARAAVAALVGFAAIFTILFGLGRLATRIEAAGGTHSIRATLSQTTLETSLKALPFGTGLGSFVPVYATVEKNSTLFEGYANRAHNDLAELLLETGLPGAVLLLGFLAWFARRSLAVWLSTRADANPLQAMLEKTATLIIVLLLAHSLADYPLRTTALGTVFAFFCAVLAAPASLAAAPAPHAAQHPRPSARRLDMPAGSDAAPGEKWGDQVQWPAGWQRPQD